MWIADMIRGIVSVWNGILTSAVALLRVNPANWANGSPWAMAADIHRDLMGIALGLMVLFWAMSFFRYIDDIHRIDGREMAGWVLRFAVIYGVMEGGMWLMEAVLGASVQINNAILAYTRQGIPETVPQDILDAADQINLGGITAIFQQITAFFEALPLTLLFLVLLIVVIVCGVVLVVTIYVRFMKLYIYTAIAPIPLSTFAGKSTSDIGKHFLKSWAAVCLEVCVISIAIAVFHAAAMADDALFTFAVTDGMDPNSALWNGSINWMTGFLIKATLLVSLVKGADRIIEKMLGG